MGKRSPFTFALTTSLMLKKVVGQGKPTISEELIQKLLDAKLLNINTL